MEAFTNTLKFNNQLFDWLKKLPLEKEQELQIIILPYKKNIKSYQERTLEGTVITYLEPFSVAINEEEWEVLK